MSAIIWALKEGWTSLWETIFPRVCHVCGRALIRGERCVCRPCLDELPSTMFEYDKGNAMAERMVGRIELRDAFSCYFFRRGESLRHLIHAFKYHGDKEVAIELGREMGRKALAGGITRFDYVVPVPLHPQRLKSRGYNQSELLALGFGEVTGTKVLTGAIERTSFAGTQTHLTAAERYANVSGNFRLGPEAEKARGKKIILIDDVFTTGATSEACLEVLKEIEGVELGLATLAYAVSG